jgi:beta-glucosidase
MKNIVILLLLSFSVFGYSQKSNKKVQIKPKTEFVAELMARMTVDEK